MRILKNFILTLCILSFLNFGVIAKVDAAVDGQFLPQKQANIAFLGFSKSGKTELKKAIENNFQINTGGNILSFGQCGVKLNFWDIFDEPKRGIIDDRCEFMDMVIITVALNDPVKDWRNVIRKNVLYWQDQILSKNPNMKIILACTNADTIADPNQLDDIKTSIDNFVSADRDLNGHIQSVTLSVTDNDSLNVLREIISQNLEETNIELLHDVNERLPIPGWWDDCSIL